MTITKDNYKEISTIGCSDSIIFQVETEKIKYEVCHRFLRCNDHSNDYIFDKLKLNGERFCSKYYKYPAITDGKVFPEYEPEDYDAATRLVKGIFDEIARREGTFEEETPKEKFSIDGIKITINNPININIKL